MKHILSIIALLSTIYAHGQIEQGLVSGTVKDAKTGESIIAAYVVVKGNSSKGTVADNDGKYSLSLPAGKLVLVFRQVGYTAQEIPIELLPNEKKSLNINLSQEMRELKTFVTTAGKYEQNI